MKKITAIIAALVISAIAVGSASALNINTATKEELAAAGLYRTGPMTAEKLIMARDAMPEKKFNSLDDVDAVSGIGAMWMKNNGPLITFTAEEEAKLQEKLKAEAAATPATN